MKINGEDVEPIDDFEQLRVMDVIWVYPCPCPQGKHRATLIRRDRGPVRSWRGRGPQVADYFDVLPAARPPCVPVDSLGTTVTPDTVRERVVYRVVDPRKTTGEDVAQGQRDAHPIADDAVVKASLDQLTKPYERK